MLNSDEPCSQSRHDHVLISDFPAFDVGHVTERLTSSSLAIKVMLSVADS